LEWSIKKNFHGVFPVMRHISEDEYARRTDEEGLGSANQMNFIDTIFSL
jgi:hypothetical protein